MTVSEMMKSPPPRLSDAPPMSPHVMSSKVGPMDRFHLAGPARLSF